MLVLAWGNIFISFCLLSSLEAIYAWARHIDISPIQEPIVTKMKKIATRLPLWTWQSALLLWKYRTFLPALLLCLFITARGLFPLALASVNCSENQLPNLMLLLQPDQVQPFLVSPLSERSQSQLSVLPVLHEAVTAWATPAAVMAYRYADSRLAGEAKRKHSTKFYTSRLRPEAKPLPFYITFLIEIIPLSCTSQKNWTHFMYLRSDVYQSFHLGNLTP